MVVLLGTVTEIRLCLPSHPSPPPRPQKPVASPRQQSMKIPRPLELKYVRSLALLPISINHSPARTSRFTTNFPSIPSKLP
jgi:hypothetical protein